MLLTKSIKIELKSTTIKHYNKLTGSKYTKEDIGKLIDVDVSLFNNGKHRVNVSCDICNNVNNVSLTSYRNSVEYDFYSCGKCKHIKRKMTNIEKYGVENYQNIDKRKKTMIDEYGKYYNNREKSKETCLKEYGVDNVSKIDWVKDKKIETTNENYGVDNPFQSEEIKNKIKLTHLKNIGVEHPSQSEEIKKKKIETCLKNLGVEYPTQSKNTIDKSREAFLEKYGVDWLTKSDEYKKMVKDTNNKMYGVDWYMSSDDFKEKSKNTNIDRYGVEYTSQNMEILDKQIKSSYNLNNLFDIKYQGSYELDFIKTCLELEVKIERGPRIEYEYKNSKKYYFSDFIINDKKTIIEIKSSYTYKLHFDKNQAKKKACIEQGYNFIFIIDKDYSEFIKMIK